MTDPPEVALARKRKKIALYFWGISLGLLVLGFLSWLFLFRFVEYTDDAYVGGNQVYITPLHSGFVTSIHTDDTFLAERGELLVELDRTDANISFDRAKEDLANATRQVCQMFHQVFAYQSEIEIKKAQLVKAVQDYQHRWGVLAAGGVSVEDYQHSVAALRSNFYGLRRTEILFEKALSLVQGTSVSNHPLVLAAADRMRDAWVYLYRCNIYSPVLGLVSQRTIQVGMWVPAGTLLMSVIPLDQIWVNANFKETQLRHMKIGQKVWVTSDLYGRGVVFHGTIVGLPGAAGNAFSLLPPQNLSGNWIKIVQRLPVRVALDPEELKVHPLRIGLSMEATVDLRDQGGLLVPTSTKGSPLYETPIFEKEEIGDRSYIDSVIRENMDTTLGRYAQDPLYLESLHMSLPPLIESVCLSNEMPPLPEVKKPAEAVRAEETPAELLSPWGAQQKENHWQEYLTQLEKKEPTQETCQIDILTPWGPHRDAYWNEFFRELEAR
ncbi:MAG: HlyD family secretion protein [Verrucomicrobiota bacterium]|nr:HlyD family secretion protein [Verrucomicrobiota bacterium]